MCVFSSPTMDTPEPVELVGNTDMFTYGCTDEDSKPELFKSIMTWHYGTFIFNGYCKSFKFPGWQDYDYHNERGVLFMVHKSLGTAKQWMNYSDVWRIIDQAKGVTVYAESGWDAVQQYLDNASLITIINNALGRF